MAKRKYSKRLPKYDEGGSPLLKPSNGLSAAGMGAGMIGDAITQFAPPTNMVAGIGGSALKGAAAGAMLGPIGAGVGAALGAGVGALKVNAAKKEQEELERKQQLQRSAQESANYQQNLKNTQANIPTFPGGGGLPTSTTSYKTRPQLMSESPYKQAVDFYKDNPLNNPETYNKLIGNPGLRNQMYNLIKGYTGTPNDSTALFTSGINTYTIPYEESNEPLYESSQGLRNALNPATRPIEFDAMKKRLNIKADGGDLQNGQESSVQPYAINYNGASHANGGIAVNGTTGNPVSITGEQADAEVEGKHASVSPQEGEIAVRFKNSSTPYIFSDKLGYAKEAKKIQNKYSKRPNDKISQDAMYGELEGLMSQQEEYKSKMIDKYATKIKELGGILSEEDVDQDDLEEMKKGGWIQKAHLKKGRCTPAPNPDCPVGSRQYNLAMTFKKHHGFHNKEDGGDLPTYAGDEPYSSFLNNLENKVKFNPNETELLKNDAIQTQNLLNGVVTSNKSSKANENWLDKYDNTPKYNLINETIPNNETSYTGQVSPLGAIANMAGNAILMATNKKAPGITAPYVNAQNVDLSAARDAIKANSIYSRANRLAALRNAGLSQGQYASAIVSVDSDLNRGTNEGLLQSYLGEQQANAGYKQQANLVNTQNAMQAQQYNAAIQDRYNKEQQEYLANLLATPAQYLSESQKAQRDALLIQTQSPNVKVTQKNRGSKVANLLLGPQSVGFNYNG